jgi:hypothetical protein
VRLSLQKLALAATLLLVSVSSAFAQTFPLPARQGQAPAICTGCPSINIHGQLNDGLKTWQFGSPLLAHTGRFLDSTVTPGVQYNSVYKIRTLRARKVRIARQQRGSAPPRAYIQLGSSVGAYSLDRFFSVSLPGGMIKVPGANRGSGIPVEKVVQWDALIHPEASGWTAPPADGMDRLFDFDFDDRGYVYLATDQFGWGIVKDNGQTDGGLLDLTKQIIGQGFPNPRIIVAFNGMSRIRLRPPLA